MLLEEIRLNTSFASGKGFYSFPILVIISGILAIVFADEMIADMGYKDFLESCHIAILFYGWILQKRNLSNNHKRITYLC